MKLPATAFIVASMIFGANTARALDQIEGSRLVIVSDAKLSGDAKRTFGRFEKQFGAYGSFFVSSDGQTAHFTADMNRQEDADIQAKALCQAKSAMPCVAYARMVPTNAVKEPAISKRQKSQFNDILRKTKRGKFGAFAINKSGGTASAVNETSSEEARKKALQLCRMGSKQQRKQFVKVFGEFQGLDQQLKCEVIAVIQKS